MHALRTALEPIGQVSGICLRVRFADGSEYQNRAGEPDFALIFRNTAAERRVIAQRHVGLLEGYFDGDVDVEGSLQLAMRAGMESGMSASPPLAVRWRNRVHEMRFSNRSRARAKTNARVHYGLGEAFYRLWLDDPYKMYTCAYWKEGTQTLEQAQQNKLEHVCRKLRLQPGESVVDIGCGWGGFLLYAQAHYGIVGTGVNTTTEQVQEMQADLARRGLQDRIKVLEADFRDIPGSYDKVCSIGVLEHAGRDQLDAVVAAHAAPLKSGGIGVLHFIGHVGRYETDYWIREHVFPGGWIPSLAETLASMERAGLEILDVENLRRHYALTLDAWAQRFDANWGKIQALDPQKFDERFRRIWRAYLYACAEMFRADAGYTHLFQIVYSKGNTRSFPMSRAFLYRGEPGAS
jgi:cyclopropane-fatty-acyl-phospholipid synthase